MLLRFWCLMKKNLVFMALDNHTANGQPQSHSTGFSGNERVEYAVFLFGINFRSRILHLDSHFIGTMTPQVGCRFYNCRGYRYIRWSGQAGAASSYEMAANKGLSTLRNHHLPFQKFRT
jgi:hypothetical protein